MSNPQNNPITPQNNPKKCCLLIPTYNNANTLQQVIEAAKPYGLPIIVVNDGSTDNTDVILTQTQCIQVVGYSKNRGKGYALRRGFKTAIAMGFSYAITMDSDGQHFASDIPKFLDTLTQFPNSLLLGSRNLQQQNMPQKNTFANKFSNFWVQLETGKKLSDTQSGFRLYPLEKMKNMRFFCNKYEFELEAIVRLAWKGVTVKSIPIQVYYAPKEERVSHFRPLRDFTRISLLNTLLVPVALLWARPRLWFKSLCKKG